MAANDITTAASRDALAEKHDERARAGDRRDQLGMPQTPMSSALGKGGFAGSKYCTQL